MIKLLAAAFGLLIAATLVAAPVLAADDPVRSPPVPLADFFRVGQMGRPLLSPSGKYLAVHVGSPNGRRRLAVLNVDPPRQPRLVAGFDDADVGRVHWAGDDRLVFDLDDHEASWGQRQAPGLFAVDQDGGNFRVLIQRDWRWITTGSAVASRELAVNHRLLRVLTDGSADAVVLRNDHDVKGELTGRTPLRLDTRNGRTTALVDDAPRGARSWWFDGSGRPRMLAVVDGERTELYWRAQPDAAWQLVQKQATFGASPRAIQDVIVGENGELYVTSSRSDADTAALFHFDSATQRIADTPLVSIDGFSFDGRLIFDGGDKRLIGVRYTSDARGTAWLSEAMRGVQDKVDKQLPGLVNLVDPAACGCARWMVVTSYSDLQPAVYWLYDHEADRLEPIGRSQPQIDPRRMARRDFVRFSARDGLEIPLHVTRPAGKGPWPTVVLVHGGPHVRGGEWGWEPQSQFLASRGYLVLEPEFRGSTGYGGRLFRAGWQQWGLKAQDDIADAARWAVAKGDADAARICIAGASYGGYATLMGLIRDPGLYRCGVAWVAVTDIGLMYDIHWSDLPEIWRRYGMPLLIGDRVKDSDRLVATSPLQQAARLRQPLLLAAGGLDRRVPPEHGTQLRDRLRAQGTPPEWVLYADEGHGFLKPENLVDFWQRVERFLRRHIGPEAATSPAPAAAPAPASAPG